MWDTLVIGSGIGGLSAAAALALQGQRVLVAEQHTTAGGLTQTFRRQDWTFATGVHYIGGVGPQPGPDGAFGRLLARLSDGALRFEPCANPYDIVRLPDFEFGIRHPQQAYRDDLQARFPAHRGAIDRWFAQCEQASRSAYSLFAMRGMPSWLAWGLRHWRGDEVQHWATRTLDDELAHVPDARLRAVLGGRWGDYGAEPVHAPFLEHALVMQSYNAGAYYPVGGPARFAQTLIPVIERAGGEVRLGVEAKRIVVAGSRAVGVELADRDGGATSVEHAAHVVSAMGVANTVACLDNAPAVAEWRRTLGALAPGLSYLALYVGLEGDVAAAGASSANHWIFESIDIGRVWHQPADEDAPGIFVAFPSLKDPASTGKPTAEVVAMVDAAAFEPWLSASRAGQPPDEDYRAFKAWVEERMLAQFLRHFPALRPMVRFHELSTPLTQARYVRSPAGATYGIEMSAERMTTPALRVRTPLAGLLLAGQDVVSPGIPGACMGGLMAAASIEPALWKLMN